MKIRYSLILVYMALCVLCSVVTGISPGILSNTPAYSTEPGTPVIYRLGEVSLVEYEINSAIIPVTPGTFQPLMPVPSIEPPVSDRWALYQELLSPGYPPCFPGRYLYPASLSLIPRS